MESEEAAAKREEVVAAAAPAEGPSRRHEESSAASARVSTWYLKPQRRSARPQSVILSTSRTSSDLLPTVEAQTAPTASKGWSLDLEQTKSTPPLSRAGRSAARLSVFRTPSQQTVAELIEKEMSDEQQQEQQEDGKEEESQQEAQQEAGSAAEETGNERQAGDAPTPLRSHRPSSVSDLRMSLWNVQTTARQGRGGGLLGAQRGSTVQAIPQEPMPDVAQDEVESEEERARKAKEWKRSRVVSELLETEKSFVSQLDELEELYRSRISGAAVISAQDSVSIFHGIPGITSTHQALLAELGGKLEGLGTEEMHRGQVGEVFKKFASFIKSTHCAYVKYKTESIALVQKLVAENESFATLLERCGSETSGGSMGLDARMQAPVQRVPRYILMLKDLSKCTLEDHPDRESVCEALQLMIETADAINEARRMSECTVRMQALDAAMVGNREEIDSTHDWVIKPTKVPTFCGFCKSFIPGLRKPHTECVNCGVVCHNKCASSMVAVCGAENKGKSKADKVRDCKLLVFTDSVLILYDADTEKPECVSLVKWSSHTTQRSLTIVDSSKDTFTATAPRDGTIHTFMTKDEEQKAACLQDITNQMNIWLENEESRSRMSTRDMKRVRSPTLTDRQAASIAIEINATVPVSSHGKVFTAYVIDVTDPYGSRTILKRYNEFHDLYSALKETLDRKQLPKLPPKRIFGNNKSEVFIQRRLKGLERFLNDLILLPGAVQNESFQTFLQQASRVSKRSTDSIDSSREDVPMSPSRLSDGQEEEAQESKDIHDNVKECGEEEEEEEGEEDDDTVMVHVTEIGGEILYDFSPESLNDGAHGVAVKAGERVTIISIETEPWWFISKEDGSSGYVPMSYVKADQEPTA